MALIWHTKPMAVHALLSVTLNYSAHRCNVINAYAWRVVDQDPALADPPRDPRPSLARLEDHLRDPWPGPMVLSSSRFDILEDTVPFRPYRMSRVTGPSPSNVKRNVSHVTRPSSGCDTVNCIFDFFGPAVHCSTQYVYQTLLEIARRETMGEGTRRGCL